LGYLQNALGVLGVKRKVVIFTVMVVVLAGLLLLARFKGRIPAGRLRTPAVASKGLAAPDFVLTDLQGHNLKLSDLRGKAVVLNFWATWCPPCKEEIPWFVELQKRYGSQGLQVIGVSMDDDGDQKDVAKFAAANSINYPVLLGKDNVANQYGGIEYLPTTFYIGRDGVVVDRVFGQPDSRDEIEKNIKRVLASTAEPRS
jgi:peroxiredoxin